ncbi:tyrosine-type recombinase/integrase [Tepidamorphus sp. 3E244]|uniref:tyrosine-type recombinase/integrase n=1 Tax=Tepidamorphus sp. 3E244 TaxID=3385498 RepID=UPI0038FCD462
MIDHSEPAMPNLSKRIVDTEKADGKRRIVWDSAVAGFGLLVLPSGTKSFVLQYRNSHGRSRRMTLGRYGTLTVDQARKCARELLVDVSKNRDPIALKVQKRTAPKVKDLFDKYLIDHVERHNAPSTQATIRDLVQRIILPKIGTLPADAVTRADVAKLHSGMASIPRQANYVLSVISKAFNCAEAWGMRSEFSNPVRGIKRYKENHRDRFLDDQELTRLGAVLNEAEKLGLPWAIKAPASKQKHLPKDVETRRTPVDPFVLAAIRLLLFTGARLSEVLTLEWRHVDLDARTLSLPARKGGGRALHPMNEATAKILEGILQFEDSPFVLPRVRDPQRHLAKEVVENAWQRVRHHAQIPDVRLHDLRHTVGTFAARSGGNAFLIGHLLRHANISMTSRYVNRDMDPIRSLSDELGERIAAGLAGSNGTNRATSRK